MRFEKKCQEKLDLPEVRRVRQMHTRKSGLRRMIKMRFEKNCQEKLNLPEMLKVH